MRTHPMSHKAVDYPPCPVQHCPAENVAHESTPSLEATRGVNEEITAGCDGVRVFDGMS